MSRPDARSNPRIRLAADTAADTAWMGNAACRHADPELFHPTGIGNPATVTAVTTAKTICMTCHVRVTCREYAEQRNMTAGVWGGHYYGNGHPPNTKNSRRLLRTNQLTEPTP